jgi:hypothetical protein
MLWIVVVVGGRCMGRLGKLHLAEQVLRGARSQKDRAVETKGWLTRLLTGEERDRVSV